MGLLAVDYNGAGETITSVGPSPSPIEAVLEGSLALLHSYPKLQSAVLCAATFSSKLCASGWKQHSSLSKEAT